MTNISSISIGGNTLEINGKWIPLNKEFIDIEGLSIYDVNNTEIVVDLTDDLPKDDYVYEISLWSEIQQNSSISVFAPGILQLKTSIHSIRICGGNKQANTSENIVYNGSGILIVGKNREIRIQTSQHWRGVINKFFITAYRRLYKE